MCKIPPDSPPPRCKLQTIVAKNRVVWERLNTKGILLIAFTGAHIAWNNTHTLPVAKHRWRIGTHKTHNNLWWKMWRSRQPPCPDWTQWRPVFFRIGRTAQKTTWRPPWRRAQTPSVTSPPGNSSHTRGPTETTNLVSEACFWYTLGVWPPGFRKSRKEEVVLLRLRIGQTYFPTHIYYVKKILLNAQHARRSTLSDTF